MDIRFFKERGKAEKLPPSRVMMADDRLGVSIGTCFAALTMMLTEVAPNGAPKRWELHSWHSCGRPLALPELSYALLLFLKTTAGQIEKTYGSEERARRSVPYVVVKQAVVSLETYLRGVAATEGIELKFAKVERLEEEDGRDVDGN